MTQPLTMERFVEASQRIDSFPLVGPTVTRLLVSDRLEFGVTGPLTLVQALPGAGKTSAVAAWASTVTEPRGLVWLEIDEATARPDVFVAKLVQAFGDAGLAGLPRLGLRNLTAASRRRAVVDSLARALRAGGPWIVVLDEFPTGAPGALGADVEHLVLSAQGALNLVVVTDGQPALPLHRIRMAGQVTTVGLPELALTSDEVAQLFLLHGVEPSDVAVTAVRELTQGWMSGVRLVCRELDHQPLETAVVHARSAMEDYLVAEVLDHLPDRTRQLVERLSLIGPVSDQALAQMIDVGHGGVVVGEAQRAGLVTRDARGQVSVIPPLAAIAASDIERRSPERANACRLRAATAFAEQGDIDRALDLAAAAGDWPWIGRTLVDRLAVVQVLAGTAGVWASDPRVLDCAPLLRAAAAVIRDDVDETRSARSEVGSGDSASARLSAALIDLAVAAGAGNVASGKQSLAVLSDLRPTLAASVRRSSRELGPLVDLYAGVLELAAGELDRAADSLVRVSTARQNRQRCLVRRRATGYLSLVEAVRGNLSRAVGMAADVVLAADRFGGDIGLPEAHVALAWAYTDRLEFEDARGALRAVGPAPALTWHLRGLAETRLLVLSGDPERASAEASAALGRDDEGWTRDVAAVLLARAWVLQGEASRALECLTPEPARTAVEARVIAAAARASIGDVRGARAVLGSASHDLVDAPMATRLDAWLLEARLTDGDDERARLLVDRSLRTARAERLYGPLLGHHTWLRSLVGRDASLSRAYRDVLTVVDPLAVTGASPGRSSAQVRGDQVLEPLSERETQVLEQLALMCSTEEIAAVLFVSGNTVKTHVKSIFRKLGVNRRVDAVRVGRALGLC